jgi:hypothetical protein
MDGGDGGASSMCGHALGCGFLFFDLSPASVAEGTCGDRVQNAQQDPHHYNIT